MYIKNQLFADLPALEECIFDFSLGTSTDIINTLTIEVNKELAESADFQKMLSTLTEEEDRMEAQTDEQRLRLCQKLMSRFDAFEVMSAQLFGISKGNKTLLYDMSDFY
jgi:hypothetical protein